MFLIRIGKQENKILMTIFLSKLGKHHNGNEIDPKILPFLPKGVELDLYNGKGIHESGGVYV
jgi:hypothetical protein